MTNTKLTTAKEPLPSSITADQANLLAKTILKDLTPAEMALAFHTAKGYGADIFTKDMWAIKDSSGRIQMYCSRDFLIKKAYQNKEFISLQASAVYEKDEITMSETEVKHSYSPNKDRWALVWAWAKANTRSGTPYIKYAELKTYKPANPNQYTPWFKDPQAMIIKCAEASVLRRFCEMTAVYIEGEIIEEEKEQLPKLSRRDYKQLLNDALEENAYNSEDVIAYAKTRYYIFPEQEAEIKEACIKNWAIS